MMVGRNTGSDETWQRIPLHSVGVEIGVWRGDTSEKFLRRARHLFLVDSWSVVPYEHSDEHGSYEAYLDRYARMVGSRDPRDFQAYYDWVHDSVASRFREQPVTIRRMPSAEFFASCEPASVDWVYVDGDHRADYVYLDAMKCFELCKNGGIILFDDYLWDDYKNKDSTKSGIDRFFKEMEGEYEILINSYQLMIKKNEKNN